MLANRIQNLFDDDLEPVVIESPAFVACPLALFANFSPTQQAFVTEIYRRAQELAEAQLQQSRRSRIPTFSLN